MIDKAQLLGETKYSITQTTKRATTSVRRTTPGDGQHCASSRSIRRDIYVSETRSDEEVVNCGCFQPKSASQRHLKGSLIRITITTARLCRPNQWPIMEGEKLAPSTVTMNRLTSVPEIRGTWTTYMTTACLKQMEHAQGNHPLRVHTTKNTKGSRRANNKRNEHNERASCLPTNTCIKDWVTNACLERTKHRVITACLQRKDDRVITSCPQDKEHNLIRRVFNTRNTNMITACLK